MSALIEFDDIINGDFVMLTKVTKDDAKDIFIWRKSKAGQHLNRPKDYSVRSQVVWIENRPISEANWIIHRKDTMAKVGMIGIYDVNEQDLVTNVGRLILDEMYINKSTPYGLEALLLGYDYAFNKIGMRKITGTILGLNERMASLQEFLGMSKEGHLKKHVLIQGNYEDLLIYSLFKEDFEGYKSKINGILNKHRQCEKRQSTTAR